MATVLPTPNECEKEAILSSFDNDLKSFVTLIPNTGELKANVCAVCDAMQINANSMKWISVSSFAKLCGKCNMDSKHLLPFYAWNEKILGDYRLCDQPLLEKYVLSPRTLVVEGNVMYCSSCATEMEKCSSRNAKWRSPPKQAIANFYLQGTAPPELRCLNDVELAIVSRIRVFSQTYVLYGGCHQQIKGWHCFLRNRHENTLGTIEQLSANGLNNTILVVMVGPFTATQKAIAKEKYQVRNDKVQAAFRWLKENNFYYANDNVPRGDELPIPHVVFEEEGSSTVASENPRIENQMNSTASCLS